MSVFMDRLQELMDERNLRDKDLRELCSISKNSITNWRKGIIPQPAMIARLADYFGVSADFLMGKTDYRDVSLSVGQILPFEPRLGARPILGDVCAGVGVIAQQSIIGWQTVDTRFDREDCFWLRVKGDSMEPIINENDLILVDKAAQMENGSIGVFLIDRGEGVIKRVKWENDTLTLIPENDAYEPMSYSGKNLSRVYYVGRVVKQERDWT